MSRRSSVSGRLSRRGFLAGLAMGAAAWPGLWPIARAQPPLVAAAAPRMAAVRRWLTPLTGDPARPPDARWRTFGLDEWVMWLLAWAETVAIERAAGLAAAEASGRLADEVRARLTRRLAIAVSPHSPDFNRRAPQLRLAVLLAQRLGVELDPEVGADLEAGWEAWRRRTPVDIEAIWLRAAWARMEGRTPPDGQWPDYEQTARFLDTLDLSGAVELRRWVQTLQWVRRALEDPTRWSDWGTRLTERHAVPLRRRLGSVLAGRAEPWMELAAPLSAALWMLDDSGREAAESALSAILPAQSVDGYYCAREEWRLREVYGSRLDIQHVLRLPSTLWVLRLTRMAATETYGVVPPLNGGCVR